MKTLTAIVILFATTTLTFAQGKIEFNNDSLHLVYFSTDTTYLDNGDATLAGTCYSSTTVLSYGGTLQADLWAGSSSDALSLYKTANFGSIPGKWVAANTLLSSPFLPPAQITYFQVIVHDTRMTGSTFAELINAADASGVEYIGWSPIFTMVPSAAVYVNLYQTTSPWDSTWPVGTQPVNGGFGAIMLMAMIPEPSTMALTVLSAAALLAFRRRR